MEPGTVVEADHAGGVTLEMEGSPAYASPVGGIGQQRGVEVRVVAKGPRHAEPVAVRRLTSAVGPQRARAQPTHVPWPDLVAEIVGLRQLVGKAHVIWNPREVVHVPVGVRRERTGHGDDRLGILRRRHEVQTERAPGLDRLTTKGDLASALHGSQEMRMERVESSPRWSNTAGCA